jgi:hypothetical protein
MGLGKEGWRRKEELERAGGRRKNEQGQGKREDSGEGKGEERGREEKKEGEGRGRKGEEHAVWAEPK